MHYFTIHIHSPIHICTVHPPHVPSHTHGTSTGTRRPLGWGGNGEPYQTFKYGLWIHADSPSLWLQPLFYYFLASCSHYNPFHGHHFSLLQFQAPLRVETMKLLCAEVSPSPVLMAPLPPQSQSVTVISYPQCPRDSVIALTLLVSFQRQILCPLSRCVQRLRNIPSGEC